MLCLSNDLTDVSLHIRSCFSLGLYLCFKLLILRVKLGLYSIFPLQGPSMYISVLFGTKLYSLFESETLHILNILLTSVDGVILILSFLMSCGIKVFFLDDGTLSNNMGNSVGVILKIWVEPHFPTTLEPKLENINFIIFWPLQVSVCGAGSVVLKFVIINPETRKQDWGCNRFSM